MRHFVWFAVVGLLLVPSLPRDSAGREAGDVKALYTKYEYRIPMRDGVRLFTAVYVPKDAGTLPHGHPILLNRTPYSVAPYGVDQYRASLGPSQAFANAGYIFAYQDVRGRMMSEGEFVNMRPHKPRKEGPGDVDESTDTYDTIDWLVKNIPNNNGRVGQYGISYPGFYTAAGMIDAHPALKASSPQAPVTDWFVGDDWHHNGAFVLPHAFNFLASFGRPRSGPTTQRGGRFEYGTPDGYDFFLKLGPLPNADSKYFQGDVPFWNELMRHGTYDAWWQARNIRSHLKGTRPAVMTVGGWFDAENLFGALGCYQANEAGSPGARNILVMGPWRHGGWAGGDGDSLGNVAFASKTSEFFRDAIEFPFFEAHLKGDGDDKLPEAYVFETGRNQWRRHDAWPPREARSQSLYFREAGQVAFEPPTDDSESASDEYVSDPRRPVPYIETVSNGMDPLYMVADQRHASRRPDVLVYQTEPLTADQTIAGPIDVELFVSTTGTDADWVVKLIDVYPDNLPDPDPSSNPTGVKLGGFQQLVRGDVLRGKFRDSFEEPRPFEPGKITRVPFRLPDVYHTFRPGHRLMVQVQSSWFPLIDRNPQTFVDIYQAKETDFKPATHRLARSASKPSRLTVRVLP